MADNDLIRRGDAIRQADRWIRGFVEADTVGKAIAAIPPVTAPQGVDAAIEALISERDYAQEMADKLAFAIGGDVIGEHSNMNCPWQNALEIADLAPAQPAPERKRCGKCNGRGYIQWHPFWDNGNDPCDACNGKGSA